MDTKLNMLPALRKDSRGKCPRYLYLLHEPSVVSSDYMAKDA